VDHPYQEEDLIDRLVAGDPSAVEALYDRYAQPVFALLVRIVADRLVAEDLLQEAFVRAWQHANRFDPARGSLLAWLLGIAHHLALNELRRRRRERRHRYDPLTGDEFPEIDTLFDTEPGPEEIAWLNEKRTLLRGALRRLNDGERVVIEMFASGYSQSEIAIELREPLGTVKTRMRRGLRKLRVLTAETPLGFN